MAALFFDPVDAGTFASKAILGELANSMKRKATCLIGYDDMIAKHSGLVFSCHAGPVGFLGVSLAPKRNVFTRTVLVFTDLYCFWCFGFRCVGEKAAAVGVGLLLLCVVMFNDFLFSADPVRFVVSRACRAKQGFGRGFQNSALSLSAHCTRPSEGFGQSSRKPGSPFLDGVMVSPVEASAFHEFKA